MSAQHAISITLMRGRAGLEEFSDGAAAATLRAGRPPVMFHDDPARDIASIALRVHTRDGRALDTEVQEALGSRRNPLSDELVEAKLFDAARLIDWRGDARRLADAIWKIDEADDAGEIARLAAGAP